MNVFVSPFIFPLPYQFIIILHCCFLILIMNKSIFLWTCLFHNFRGNCFICKHKLSQISGTLLFLSNQSFHYKLSQRKVCLTKFSQSPFKFLAKNENELLIWKYLNHALSYIIDLIETFYVKIWIFFSFKDLIIKAFMQ